MHTPLPGIEDGGMAHGSDLDRFVAAQAPMFEQVACELGAGEKRSHWMRFVFPQLVGVGDLVAWVSSLGTSNPSHDPGHAMRTYSGRPRSSMRFSTPARRSPPLSPAAR